MSRAGGIPSFKPKMDLWKFNLERDPGTEVDPDADQDCSWQRGIWVWMTPHHRAKLSLSHLPQREIAQVVIPRAGQENPIVPIHNTHIHSSTFISCLPRDLSLPLSSGTPDSRALHWLRLPGKSSKYLQSRNRDTDVENKHMNTKQGREVGWTGRQSDIYTWLTLCIKKILMRNYYIAQGTLLSAPWWPKLEGNLKKKKRECMYTCGQFTLL